MFLTRADCNHPPATIIRPPQFTKQDGTTNSVVAARIESKNLLPHVDGRSLPYQRYKAIVQQMVDEQGGVEKLSAARAQLIRRFAALG